ncbi:MAG: hypothetical protein U0324_43450 [Polyangiales bacterium]
MMTREEFERTVRAMKAEGVPLSMPNLMLRTELPRHLIEDWLEDMAVAERRPPAAAKPGRDAKAEGDAKGEGPADDLLRKVNRLKDEVIGDAAKAAVKERLGLGGDEEPVRVHGATKRPQKDLRVGAGLGLVGGPLGLFYAAPYPVAIATSAAYVAALVGLNFIPVVGSMLVAYLLPIVHLTSAAAGAGYTWRYNRAGRRAALLPKNRDA